MGLAVEYEAYALLQLGSSLRNVGRVREAVQTLTEAERRYPQFPALSAFLALAQYSHGDFGAALKTALTAMIRHIPSSDIKRYAGALDTYVAALK